MLSYSTTSHSVNTRNLKESTGARMNNIRHQQQHQGQQKKEQKLDQGLVLKMYWNRFWYCSGVRLQNIVTFLVLKPEHAKHFLCS